MKQNKYHDTIKIEFRELMQDFVESKRRTFHGYTIHRALTTGLLIGFTFDYVRNDDCRENVHIKLNLEEFGAVTFYINIDSGYGNVLDAESKETMIQFINQFDTELTKETYQRRRLA